MRRLPPSEREDSELVIAMRGTPMKAKAESAAAPTLTRTPQNWSWVADVVAPAARGAEETKMQPQATRSEGGRCGRAPISGPGPCPRLHAAKAHALGNPVCVVRQCEAAECEEIDNVPILSLTSWIIK